MVEGYEDPLYRFYHQSFKLHLLQHDTLKIVATLESLAPERPLNSPRHTRAILEAFFHPRFFLEMAVRYSDAIEPPESLRSGYTALLCLYGLR